MITYDPLWETMKRKGIRILRDRQGEICRRAGKQAAVRFEEHPHLKTRIVARIKSQSYLQTVCSHPVILRAVRAVPDDAETHIV